MKKGFFYLRLIMILLAMAFFCQATVQAQGEPSEIILRLHGSNTIGAKLAPALGTAFLQEMLMARDIRVESTTTNELRLVASLPGQTIAIEINSHGSSTGFLDLKSGSCDIGMSSRQIKEKEVASLAFLGDMGSLLGEHTLGLDGIAVIVHPDNPMQNIPIETLREIFSGKISDWSEVTGEMSGPILVHARDAQSGTFDTFKSLVLGKKTPLVGSAIRYESNSKLSDTVANSKNSIGFCGLPYILRAKALAVAEQGAAPIAPSNNSVATEDYPLSRRLYFYTPPYPENIYTRFFLDFALSRRGQEIVDKVGFIGQNISVFEEKKESHVSPQNPEVVASLKVATRNAKRVSLNFRFKTGSSALDDRSERDLIRLARFLKTQDRKKILLIGFTDSGGNYQHNRELAQTRAMLVHNRLRQVGANGDYHILSGGEEFPVASNGTPKGRQKNRRVEVWLDLAD